MTPNRLVSLSFISVSEWRYLPTPSLLVAYRFALARGNGVDKEREGKKRMTRKVQRLLPSIIRKSCNLRSYVNIQVTKIVWRAEGNEG